VPLDRPMVRVPTAVVRDQQGASDWRVSRVAITIIDEKRQHVQNDFEDRVEALNPPGGGPRDVLGQPPPSRPGPSSWEATEQVRPPRCFVETRCPPLQGGRDSLGGRISWAGAGPTGRHDQPAEHRRGEAERFCDLFDTIWRDRVPNDVEGGRLYSPYECWPDRSSRSPTYAPSERAVTFALKRTFRLS
jgi:hypothetical protein